MNQKDLIEIWERYNHSSAEEKRWMNERLNWLYIPQSVLLTGYGFFRQYGNGDAEFLLSTIAWVGLLLSFFVLTGVVAAGRMHWKWTSILNCLACRINRYEVIVSFGQKPHWPARSSSVIPALVVLTFLVAWCAVVLKYHCS